MKLVPGQRPVTKNCRRSWNLRDGALIAIVAVLCLVLGLGLANWLDKRDSVAGRNPVYSDIGGDFTLKSSQGPVSLSDFRSRVVVLYFGYGSCPDVCPNDLNIIATALRQLETGEQKQIQPMFVSVDPGRDTPLVLKEYAGAFYPGMLGLTGSKEQVDIITAQYRIFYEHVAREDSTSGYGVNHSSATFIIGRDGVLQDIVGHGAPLESLVGKLKTALAS